jgi:diaminopimelate decarboxylase
MKGRDTQSALTHNEQNSFHNFIKDDPLSSAFLVYNQSSLEKQIAQWKQKLSWITPFYAIKSNPIPPLLRDMRNQNIGFDCASKGEIRTAIKFGCNPASEIIYSNSIKEERDILYALKKGVALTTADTLDELIKLQNIATQHPNG